jgi:hypothetical protein
MKRLLLILLVVYSSNSFSQRINSQVPEDKQYFIGSTLFVPFALFLDDSPQYYQLDFGYRINTKNTVAFEVITWKYPGPLGRPYGSDYESEETNFPGEVQAFGAGLSYQRFLWKGLYGQVHSTAFKQNYLELNGDKIQSGFQLFNTFRVGYHVEFFNNHLFIEPSIAMTWWPINTNLPESFQVEEDKWNKFFLGEPGLHFGVNF